MILREASLVDSLSNPADIDDDDDEIRDSSYISWPDLLEQIEKGSTKAQRVPHNPKAANRFK